MIIFLSSIVAFGILMVIGFSYPELSRIMAETAQIATGVAVAVAVITYLYNKKHNDTKAAINLYKFLRKELMPLYEKTYDLDGHKFKPFERLDNFDRESIFEKNPEEFKRQIKNLKFPTDSFNEKYYSAFHDYANCLTEFALRVKVTNMQDSPELEELREAFIEMIEMTAPSLCHLQYFKNISADKISTVAEIYMLWSDGVKRRTELIKESIQPLFPRTH